MPPSSSVIDWDMLKPEILRLLSAGDTHKDVIEKFSKQGCCIKKSQLEYQLKCWGQRTNLTAQGWRYASHKVKKRAKDKKKSDVFFNGALISKAKFFKETRRHDPPTLLPASGESPRCPDGLNLVICTPPLLADSPPPNIYSHFQHSLPNHGNSISSLPWVEFYRGLHSGLGSMSLGPNRDTIDLRSFTIPAPSQFPGKLIDLCGMRKTLLGLIRLAKPCTAILQESDTDHALEGEVAPLPVIPHGSHIRTLQVFCLQIFQLSNHFSTADYQRHNMEWLSKFGNTVKLVAKNTSNWKSLLTAGAGATSRALIEKLFDFSIIRQDQTLAELMLQIGADPNQQIFDWKLQIRISALDYTVLHMMKETRCLLLESGSAYDQMSLKYAVTARDLDTASHILRSDQSLDLNFNYINALDPATTCALGRLRPEKATLLGLVCLGTRDWNCYCRVICHPRGIDIRCPRCASIKCLEFLISEGAEITLDTMIVASLTADVATLRFLMQHGGKIEGQNIFGFTCLDAASLRKDLQYDVFSLLLASGTTAGMTRTHRALDSRASLVHRLLLVHGNEHENSDEGFCQLVDLLVESGAEINYRHRQVGSPAELALAHEKFLWSQPTHYATPADLIADSKAESLLEYAIVLGYELLALGLLDRQCHLTGREITLAAKFGLVSVLCTLIERDESNFDKDKIGRTILQLGLRWGHDLIVQYLLDKGVKLGEYDIIDALQYPGKSVLSSETQMKLIEATPELDRLQIFGLSLLELCCLKFKTEPVRQILRQFPAAYDSGACSAIAFRALNRGGFDVLNISDLQNMTSRRLGKVRDWEKENTAMLIAAMCCTGGPDVLRLLAPPGTTCAMNTARIQRRHFSSFLDPQCSTTYLLMDPTHSLGCQDWISCSPLIGVALAPKIPAYWSIAEAMFDHLLACSYEPDAFTVVITAARGNLSLLRRLVCHKSWRSILSIDDDSRPPWCPTALQAAASQGNEEIVELLLEAGTSVNEAPADEPIGKYTPRTALQAAVDRGNLRLTNLFVERGACVNAPAAEDSGATALQLACIRGYLGISLRLLELGADVNARAARKNGRTALEGAAEYGRIDTIQLLLNDGVYTEESYREQYLKAVLYAENNGHFAAAALLKGHREWTAEDEECYGNLRLGKE